MKTEYYALEDGRGGYRKMVKRENGEWVRREDHDRQVQGLVDELAKRDNAKTKKK